MDVNLTAVSANRKLGKALVRTPAFRKRLTELVAPLSHPDCDILQVVMHDRPASHVEVRHISKGELGRLLQSGVGVPEELTFLPADDAKFVDACAAQLALAIRKVKMSDELRAALLRCVEQARVECREQSRPRTPLAARSRQDQ